MNLDWDDAKGGITSPEEDFPPFSHSQCKTGDTSVMSTACMTLYVANLKPVFHDVTKNEGTLNRLF